MHLCGLLTLALNTAEPLLARHYGRAALDTVAPALLLGWGAVGPTLLRHLHTPTDPTQQRPAPPSPVDTAPLPAQRTRGRAATPDRTPQPAPALPGYAKPAGPGKRTGRPPAATMDQLIATARPAVAEHGVSVAVVKQALRYASTPVGSARFTQLMKHLKDEHASSEANPEVQPDPEPARAHSEDA
jgi:hypothetical protein